MLPTKLSFVSNPHIGFGTQVILAEGSVKKSLTLSLEKMSPVNTRAVFYASERSLVSRGVRM
jgi:hypothetical protein